LRSLTLLDLEGTEHRVNDSLVPIGGKLPYFQELQTGKLLDVLITFVPGEKRSKDIRQRINKWLYPKTRPGYYLEINDNFHLAYADQRDGHGTQHYKNNGDLHITLGQLAIPNKSALLFCDQRVGIPPSGLLDQFLMDHHSINGHRRVKHRQFLSA
jgi:hypothetical protein